MVINLSRPGFSPLSLWLLPRCWMNEELIGQHGAAAEPHWPPHASQTSTGDPQLWQYSDNVKTNTMHMVACIVFCHICHQIENSAIQDVSKSAAELCTEQTPGGQLRILTV